MIAEESRKYSRSNIVGSLKKFIIVKKYLGGDNYLNI